MGAGGDGLTGSGMGVGSGMLRDYTDEDRYDDKFEYQRSFHYRPNAGPRIKYNQWKNPLLRFWCLIKELMKEFFLGSK